MPPLLTAQAALSFPFGEIHLEGGGTALVPCRRDSTRRFYSLTERIPPGPPLADFPPFDKGGFLRFATALTACITAYSSSTVAGGLEVISYNTRLTPRTSLTMRVETRSRTSKGMRVQSAVIKSLVTTLRRAMA